MARSNLLSTATKFAKWSAGRKKKARKITGLSKAEIAHIRSMRGFAKRRKKKRKHPPAQEVKHFYYAHFQRKKKTIYNQ